MSSGGESGSKRAPFAEYISGKYLSGRWVAESPGENRARAAYAGLLATIATLVPSYFRLERAARAVIERARRRRPRREGSAARQVELERKRLGRELHTGLGQMLVAIRLQLDLINTALSHPEPAVARALDHAAMLISEAHGEVRSISSRLHPPGWHRFTLEQALRRLWDISGVSQHYAGELRIELLTTEPDLDAKTLIYRAMQEALSNLVRHAGASRIDIVLARRGPWLVLEAQDNGMGFDPARRTDAGGATAGLGLRAIQEQTEELRGQFLVETGPSGTKLVISIPFH